MMDQLREKRQRLNGLMQRQDDFYRQFGGLDDLAYADGAISKKNKELMGLAISVATRCDECIAYHIGQCAGAGADKEELVEAIRIGVIAGGSISYPNARFAFSAMEELGIL